MKKTIQLLIITALLFGNFNIALAGNTANRLKGKILLQVEANGEGWYVNPDNAKRYYLGRPVDAFSLMRELGLGISNKDFDSFNGYAPTRLSGKILLKVEDNGKAYYVNPDDLKMHYLGKPEDAFQVMRTLGLGITNNDLYTILENGQIDTSNLKVLNNAEIIKQLKDSVVYIETYDGSGSGFIIDTTGCVFTNAHVVQGVDVANVILANNSTLSAKVVGRDEDLDLALLKVEKTGLLKASLGDSNSVKQGDEIFTLGYPFGIKGDVSFKEGTISRTLKGDGYEYFETSADIHPGNSGGPLVNRYGQVIGINTAIYGESVQGISVGETIKLAIPINVAKNILTDLKNGRNVVNEIIYEYEEEPEPEPVTCSDSLSKIEFVDNKYKTFTLGDFDTDIKTSSNEMKLYGVLKNNSSSCIASNIKMKVTLSDKNNPELKQEETLTLRKELSIIDIYYDVYSINPNSSNTYEAKFTVYDSFMTTYDYFSKALKDNIGASTQIVSVDWLPVN